MALNWVLPVRAVQLVFAVIELGLTAYVSSIFFSSPSQVNFMIFNSVWTIVVVVFLVLAPRYDADGRHAGHKFTILAVDAVTALFWFAGFIALAVWLGVPDCGGSTVCGCAKAAVAFGAFLWVLFTVTAVLDAVHVVRTRGTRSSKPHPGVQSGAYEGSTAY